MATSSPTTQPAPDPSHQKGGSSLTSLIDEVIGLVVAYAKQETLEPIKALGRFVAFGVAGAMLLAVGGAIATLAAVRIIQAEAAPHLNGDLTWVPYIGGILVAGGGATLAILRIGRRMR